MSRDPAVKREYFHQRADRPGKAVILQGALAIAGAMALGQAGCNSEESASTQADGAGLPAPVAAPAAKKLYLDVHELGSGKVDANAVAAAHAKDLATEAKYGVDYKAYWFDEKAGRINCLVEAPSSEAASAVHKEAHGLVADRIMQVTGDNASWTPEPGKTLYLDVHHLDPNRVTAQDVAAAHQKDLAEQGKHGVEYLNYWFDAESGTVMCLSEAPSAEAAIAVHREAHGLLPDSIAEVTEGR
jgi:hypothetical protein